jgi:uncharacterized protein YjbI with pentapeptide repeats
MKLRRTELTVIISTVILLFLITTLLYRSFPEVIENYFGEKVSLAKLYTYLGSVVGVVIVLEQIVSSYRRNRLQEEYNSVIAKGNLDNRFRDASLLLGNESSSAQLSGVYALNQIAIDAHADGRDGYVEVIKKILCAVLRDGSKQEQPFVVQTILDLIFRSETSALFGRYPTDLSGAMLKDMNLENADLQRSNLACANLEGAMLAGANLENAILQNANLNDTDLKQANLTNADFNRASLNRALMSKANLTGAQINYADLKEAILRFAILDSVQFNETHLEGADFSEAQIAGATRFNSAFIDSNTNFFETALAGKSSQEIRNYKPV